MAGPLVGVVRLLQVLSLRVFCVSAMVGRLNKLKANMCVSHGTFVFTVAPTLLFISTD